jgi:hypothetical protein
MTVKISIISLSPDEMIIAPALIDRWTKDNSAEMPMLKEQLKNIGLLENEDYTIDSKTSYTNHSQIKFNSKSIVVRALWTIPAEMIELSDLHISLGQYNKAKLVYATTLPQKLCYVPDQQFREKAYNDFYLYVKSEINKVHAAESKHTTVIMQKLDHDLLFVEQKVIENIWSNTPKSHLALVCLIKAYKDEIANPSLREGGISGFFKKTSRLAPLYEAIIKNVCTIQDSDFNKLCDLLLSQYDTLITTPQKKPSGLSATAASH